MFLHMAIITCSLSGSGETRWREWVVFHDCFAGFAYPLDGRARLAAGDGAGYLGYLCTSLRLRHTFVTEWLCLGHLLVTRLDGFVFLCPYGVGGFSLKKRIVGWVET